MLSYRMARRSFLGSVGASALLLPLLRNIEAHAQGVAGPVRFLVIHHPLGTIRNRWLPTVTADGMTLNYANAPFEPLKSRMVIIDGMNLVATSLSGTAGTSTHEGGMVAMMVGQPELRKLGQEDHVAGGASIDQILLAQSPKLRGTQYGSLQLAADNRSDRDEVAPRVMSYQVPANNNRSPLYPSIDPLEVYNRIFGGAVAQMGESELVRVRAQKQSVLDFMKSDLARLRGLVPSAEKVKIDAHESAIRSLETTFDRQFMMDTTSMPGMPSCQKPTDPGALPINSNYYYQSQPAYHPHAVVGQLQLSLIQAAFACDLARVATFMWSPGTNHVVFGGDLFSANRSSFPSNPVSEHHPPSHTTDTLWLNWLAEIDRWYADQTSQALQKFAGTMDSIAGDNSSLLDNTVVVYVSEIARAYDHDFENAPLVVFGSQNVGIKGGRFINVAQSGGNRPSNDLWLSLAPIFGVDLPKLGDSTQWSGPISGLVDLP